MLKSYTSLFISILLLAGLASCEGFFGKKTDKSFLDVPVYNDQTVAYVPIQPALTGFVTPVDVITGWDELIYVADSAQQIIFAYDEAANLLGKIPVRGLRALAQDRNFDLMAAGIKDTTVGNIAYQLPAIYRIRLMDLQGKYDFNNPKIQAVAIHPFCFNPAATPNASDLQVRFNAIGMLADGDYYIAKTGATAAGTIQGDAIVLFNRNDQFISPIFVTTQVGTFNNYFKQVRSLTTYAQPPQSPAVNRKGDFVFASWDEAQVLKVQGIVYKETDNGASYEVVTYPQAIDTTKGKDVLYRPYRFAEPSDLTIAGDATGYLFVTDAIKDSLYVFNGIGYEGVNAPAGSANPNRAIKVSFGGSGRGFTQFRRPMGVCYKNKIVYVADAGNGRVLRFQLTTDFR